MNTLALYAATFLCCTIHSYHIGNSISRDGYGEQPGMRALEALAMHQGQDLDIGEHFLASNDLPQIWAQPDNVSRVIYPYGDFTNALLNYKFDYVTLQPWGRKGSTLGSDKQAIDNFVNFTRQNPANHDTTFYVYQVWCQQDLGRYATYWDGAYENNDASFTETRRGYYNSLLEWADDTYTPLGIKVRQIPTAEVFYRLSLMDEAGELPIPFKSFYRDKLHASKDIGRYVVSATMFSTMFQQKIDDVMPLDSYFNPTLLTPELVTLINRTVWDVVSTDLYAGIYDPSPVIYPEGDLDEDGYVDASDFALWREGFAANASGDVDGDGGTDGRDFMMLQRNYRPLSGDLNNDRYVDGGDLSLWQEGYSLNANGDADGDRDTDGRDFLILQRNYHPSEGSPGPLSASLAVPEPSSVVLLLVAAVAVNGCRCRL